VLGARSGAFGFTSVAAALAGVCVLGSVRGSSHPHRGENNPQRNFIRLMALPHKTDKPRNAVWPCLFPKRSTANG
jgi:hypothetical protein